LLLEHNLRREGYQTLTASDGQIALETARSRAPHLILLDLMLPTIDGIEVCRQLKSDPLTSATPVVMVTAKSEESDAVLGLGVGAEDYIVKPFRIKELLARVRACLRRTGNLAVKREEPPTRWGDLTIDTDRHEVRVGGLEVNLTPTEFRLLQCLANNPGRAFTREYLVSRAMGPDAVVLPRNIDVHVRALRKKLGSHGDLIQTVRSIGYRFRD
jgi:DNA-binding response OmpR family regulator